MVSFSVLVGTRDGFSTWRCEDLNQVALVGSSLNGQAVRAIVVDPHDGRTLYVGCGLPGSGLHRSIDGGRSFAEVAFGDRWVWDAWFHPVSRELWVGTEPPMLYRATDGDFAACSAIDQLPSRPHWSFFHAPYFAGHIHGLAAHAARPERVYAGVEHGALIFTEDMGATWRETLVGYDMHRVAVDPEDPDRVFAGAGGGLYVSEDGGLSWASRPVLSGYVHAILFDERRPGRVFVYASRLYRSEDGGRSWREIGRELPAAGPVDSLTLDPSGTVLLYGAGEAGIFGSVDAGESWRRLPIDVPRIWRLRAAPSLELGD